jgi:hypothetical protein
MLSCLNIKSPSNCRLLDGLMLPFGEFFGGEVQSHFCSYIRVFKPLKNKKIAEF